MQRICTGSSYVFDGRARKKLKVEDTAISEIKPGRLGVGPIEQDVALMREQIL